MSKKKQALFLPEIKRVESFYGEKSEITLKEDTIKHKKIIEV